MEDLVYGVGTLRNGSVARRCWHVLLSGAVPQCGAIKVLSCEQVFLASAVGKSCWQVLLASAVGR